MPKLKPEDYLNKNELINLKTKEYRQRMLDFFNREGGATFNEMHKSLDPDAGITRVNYHFYELKDTGYLKLVGLKKEEGMLRGQKLWVGTKKEYMYQPQVIRIDEREDVKPVSSGYVNGVCKVKMRHVTRVPIRTGKVYIGSTMGML